MGCELFFNSGEKILLGCKKVNSVCYVRDYDCVFGLGDSLRVFIDFSFKWKRKVDVLSILCKINE